MAFVNLSLLIGGLFTAIPIVLHLVMRQQPKRLVFPALQFLQRRKESNRRKLQLRQWLLLALRCVAIALLALAFARPSVASTALGGWLEAALLLGILVVTLVSLAGAVMQGRGRVLVGGLSVVAALLALGLAGALFATARRGTTVLLGDQQAPVAAALVVDTSPSMAYKHGNRSRLAQARDIADWLIRQFPGDSQIAVMESRPGPAIFSVDAAAAQKTVQRLRSTPLTRPLPDAIQQGLRLVETSDLQRKEVYVLTDLTRSSWGNDAATLRQRLDQTCDVTLYLIDVGVDDPQNTALGDLQLSAESLASNNELVIETEVSTTSRGPRAVDLLIEQPDSERPIVEDGKTLVPSAIRRDRQAIVFDQPGAQRVRLTLGGLDPGVHHGRVQLVGEDSLEVDDVRHFTIEVRQAWPVLVAAPADTITTFLTEAIAPFEFRQNGQARFDCTVIDQSDLPNQQLENFAIVTLIDPAPLAPGQWQQLEDFVEQGGGLAIFLGHHAEAGGSFHAPSAVQLIGGRLDRVWRAGGRDLFLAPQQYNHPVLSPFRDQPTSVPWNLSPVLRHWGLDDLQPETDVVIRYGNGQPALIETALGRGRVLTLTTPVSDPAQPAGRSAWNELPTSEAAWPYFVLVNEMFPYLAGEGQNRLNYTVGEPVVLPNDPARQPPRYELFPPSAEPLEVTAGDGEIVVRFTEQPGAYRLKGFRGGPVRRGFAVNLPARESDLQRVPRDELNERLGENRYQYARNREEIVLEVGEARVGREFYPYLLAILAVVFGLEHLLSNRFYRPAS